jgi:hypothetical protein
MAFSQRGRHHVALTWHRRHCTNEAQDENNGSFRGLYHAMTQWPWLVAASMAVTAMARRWNSASSSPNASSLMPKVLEQTSKLVVASLVLLRLLGSPVDTSVLVPFVGALAAVLSACTIVQRSPGTVVPTALVGLVGSTLVQPLVGCRQIIRRGGATVHGRHFGHDGAQEIVHGAIWTSRSAGHDAAAIVAV